MARNSKPITLKPEVIDAPVPAGLQESEQALDAILDADFTSPTELKLGLQYFSKHNPAFRFYRDVQPRLSGWWEEFSQELDQKTGGPKYKTIYQFARSKSKIPKEQKWIEMMIGPEPATYNQKNGNAPSRWLRIPWLGDWKARRLNGYWAPDNPAKVKAIARAIKEKLSGLEAVQSSAPYLVQMMARYERMAEQIDAQFGGQCVDLAKGPDKQNIARFYTYFEMHKAVTIIKLRLLHEWRLTHGINMLTGFCTQNFLQTNQNFGTVAGIADGLTNEQLETVKLARMLTLHEDNFNMPLPKDDIPQPHPEKEAVRPKGNGKVM